MNHTVKLQIMFPRALVQFDDCIAFRYEKERYTPYSTLNGQWYCPSALSIDETVMIRFYIDNVMVHVGFPASSEIIKKDGRTILKLSSTGYSAMLMTNQCAEGLIPDVNLTGIIQKAGFTLPNIAYQQNTPVANYVNYYDGTSLWDAIVIYSLRVGGKHFPYLSGSNTIRIEPLGTETTHEITPSELISRSSRTDYSRMISKITMKGVDGTPAEYVRTNPLTSQRSIVRCREINFDREWIMAPEDGVQHKFDYSMRALSADVFSFFGYLSLDLLDRLSVSDLGFNGEVDRFTVSGSAEKGIVTTVWCYHDAYCA